MGELPGFMLAGFALAGSPGPATLSLAAAGAAFGALPALGYLIGIIVGMVAVMGIVGAGVAGLLLAAPGAAPVLGVAAAAYFVHLAFRIATAPPVSEVSRRPPSFAGGVFLSLVNPKGYAAMTALFSGFVLAPDSAILDATAKIAALAAIIVAVDFAWLAAGAALTRLFRNPRTSRAINLVFAGLLLASVGFALLL
jgi:threonine/homoserine/homoserine lactone efflux protein